MKRRTLYSQTLLCDGRKYAWRIRIFTDRIREGTVFTGVCHSFCECPQGGGVWSEGQGVYPGRGDSAQRGGGGVAQGVLVRKGVSGQGGADPQPPRWLLLRLVRMHPNGMHSCDECGRLFYIFKFHRLSDVSNGDTAARWDSMVRRSGEDSHAGPNPRHTGEWRTIYPEDTGPTPQRYSSGSRTSLISNRPQDPGFMNWGQWRTIKPL